MTSGEGRSGFSTHVQSHRRATAVSYACGNLNRGSLTAMGAPQNSDSESRRIRECFLSGLCYAQDRLARGALVGSECGGLRERRTAPTTGLRPPLGWLGFPVRRW